MTVPAQQDVNTIRNVTDIRGNDLAHGIQTKCLTGLSHQCKSGVNPFEFRNQNFQSWAPKIRLLSVGFSKAFWLLIGIGFLNPSQVLDPPNPNYPPKLKEACCSQ